MKYCLFLMSIFFMSQTALGSDKVVQDLFNDYSKSAASGFDASRGESLWYQEKLRPDMGRNVSCASCHGNDLRLPGHHLRTGKKIDPMAPSVNPNRFGDAQKVEKWFRRNCKWTWGRQCTPQEKGDILKYLISK
ncbi:MAG: DUF1924 domain-containing protein [Bacteroidetes bacterium]|nr:MAG: DUF1924 domain-containing protein [Bacteroidota bacterium]